MMAVLSVESQGLSLSPVSHLRMFRLAVVLVQMGVGSVKPLFSFGCLPKSS